MGNKFLSNIREVDAIVHVVRCFENDDIVHVEGSIDPKRDIETINLELILSDMEILDRGENVEPGETQVFGGAEEGENAHEDGEDAQTTENTED